MTPNSANMEQVEDNDDAPVGRVLSRREVLGLLAGLGGIAVLAACDPSGSTIAQPTSVPTQAPTSAASATAVAATPVEASPTANAAAVPDCVVRPALTEGPY